MKIGVIVPQGWTGEYAGWEPASAWRRSVEIAVQAEELGFDSVWAFDHFHTTPEPTDAITFESFAFLAGLAMRTSRVRLGHIVICAGFRNPALIAKAIGTLDVMSGGRMELGIGAGWKREEWEAYGYRFPPLRDRLASLADGCAVIDRMLSPGRATYAGVHASVADAINEPRGLQQPRVPLMVGGNGREVTWRIAARYADELNLDAMSPADVAAALPVIESRCEEIGRDPATLRVSVHVWWEHLPVDAGARTDLLRSYADLGIHRVQTLARSAVEDPSALVDLAQSAAAAGLELRLRSVA